MDINYETAVQILRKNNQEHIIKFMNSTDETSRKRIIEQVLRIDFEELKELQEKTYEALYVDLEELQPITAFNPDIVEKQVLREYENIGEEIIKSNKYAVATMAGGQGTRLRISIPKGNI